MSRCWSWRFCLLIGLFLVCVIACNADRDEEKDNLPNDHDNVDDDATDDDSTDDDVDDDTTDDDAANDDALDDDATPVDDDTTPDDDVTDDDDSFPPSIPIVNVSVEDHNTYLVPDPLFEKSCGDLWAQAWADDGYMYAANGDGFAFGWVWADIKVSRIAGSPPDMMGHEINGAFGPLLGRLWPPEWWLVSRKPTGMICVDGVLYLYYQNLKNFLSDNEFGDAPAASVSWSADHGRTWEWNTAGPMFHDHVFTTGFFLDTGQCNEYAKDEFVYIYGLDYNWRYSEGYRSTNLYLARVPKEQIPDRSAWTFFTGTQAGGDPVWSSDIGAKQPVLNDETEYAGNTGVSQGSVVFVPALNRYLYSTWSDTAWIFWEAEFPWGPWTRIGVTYWYDGPWTDEFHGGYATVVPSKFLSADGTGGWIVSSILNSLENTYYRYSMRPIFIETSK